MNKLILFAVVAVLASVGTSTQAAEDHAGNIGASYGISVPDYSGTTSRSILGLQGTAKLGTEWGLGGYYLSSSKSETSNNTTGDFGYQLYGVKGTYHFEGEARGVYLGGMIGVSKVHAINYDTSPSHYGVLAGYDKMLGEMFSVGGEFSYISIGGSSTTYNGASKDVNSFNTLNFSVGVKFWF